LVVVELVQSMTERTDYPRSLLLLLLLLLQALNYY
jgi:hypothetical protein